MAAVVLTPSNTSQYQDTSSSSLIEIALPDSASSMKAFAQVQPLFNSALQSLQPWGLGDPLFHLTPTNSNNLTGHWIAYMSCDPSVYPGNIGASDVINTALAVQATAILLYSTSADYCNVTALGSSYPYIYSMTNTTSSQSLLDRIDSAPSDSPLHALISFADQVQNNETATPTGSSSSSSSTSASTSNNKTLGASPTTAVAMIILYSITGIITALFLVIIITGAVRAHRHPERYGPRNQVGRTRQSRARGLAIAMLDTIPIVKFGEREPPKQVDLELADNGQRPTEETGAERTTVDGEESSGGSDADPHTLAQPRRSTASVRSGIAPATNGTDSSPVENSNADAPGCSICTEDFELGEDLRVLPCDHKFHPACIDPWLLNISGTCPLCRIDLNPQGSTPEPAVTDASDLPPPIDGGDTTTVAGRPRIGMRQSFLIGLGLGRVHDTTREERLNAVRQLRVQQREANERDRERERDRRRRFRDRFGIRTSQRGQENEAREQGADAETDATVGAERQA